MYSALRRHPPGLGHADQILHPTCYSFSNSEYDDLNDYYIPPTFSDENPAPSFAANLPKLNNMPPKAQQQIPESGPETTSISGPAPISGLTVLTSMSTHAPISTPAPILNTVDPRYRNPNLPLPTFLSVFHELESYKPYADARFPPVTGVSVKPTTHEPLQQQKVNAIAVRALLDKATVLNPPLEAPSYEWIEKAIFPDTVLPRPFNPSCLDRLPECWDSVNKMFPNFPDVPEEGYVQDWINHLAHCLGVEHGLIQRANDTQVEDSIMEGPREGEEAVGHCYRGVVISGADDRAFSDISCNKYLSGAHAGCKPDIILFQRNILRQLKKKKLRPRWHHVLALVEVSKTASKPALMKQIREKAALTFEAQPFRCFVLGIAIQRPNVELPPIFTFMLVDRAGVVSTRWTHLSRYDGKMFARIVYALSYALPQHIGLDPCMTLDPVNGWVTHIKVNTRTFRVERHIHSTLVLFGRGTHVFLVRDEHNNLFILKDSWILTAHTTSEIDVLKAINETIAKENKAELSSLSSRLQAAHPQFVTGQEIDEDATLLRRGELANVPPQAHRVHRRVVTGPVGDAITTFRSQVEFIQVMIDCVNWLDYLHNKCNLIHGDLSINNVVIYRKPPPLKQKPSPPAQMKSTTVNKPSTSNISAKKPSTTNLPSTISKLPAKTQGKQKAPRTTLPQRDASNTSKDSDSEHEFPGTNEPIAVTGVVIDYDYACGVNVPVDKTSGTTPFMPLAALGRIRPHAYIHGPEEDLESLLHTLICVVMFTAGPCGQLRNNEYIPASRWFNEIDLEQLRRDKLVDLEHYDNFTAPYLHDYWKPFSPYVQNLIDATYRKVGPDGIRRFTIKSVASHQAFRRILTEAHTHFSAIQETSANYAHITIPAPRSSEEQKHFPYVLDLGVGELRYLPHSIMPFENWMDTTGN